MTSNTEPRSAELHAGTPVNVHVDLTEINLTKEQVDNDIELGFVGFSPSNGGFMSFRLHVLHVKYTLLNEMHRFPIENYEKISNSLNWSKVNKSSSVLSSCLLN